MFNLLTAAGLLLGICVTLFVDQISADSDSIYYYEKANEYSVANNGRAFLVLKNGRLVFEAYGPGYSADTVTDLHSATKSFWCSAIAAMVDDGIVSSFDEKISDTIGEWRGEDFKSRITLRQILDLSSGLKPTNPATDPLRQENQRGKYTLATELVSVFPPGSRFFYGPNHYYVLGEYMQRKLGSTKENPLDYLKKRILDRIDVNISSWEHDGSGEPNMPNGAHIKPHDWLRYGQFILQQGKWEGRQIVRADLIRQCLQPSQANAGYGLTFWLNSQGGAGSLLQGLPQANSGSEGGFIYPDGLPDLAMAAGAGMNRMYVIPSLNMVIVRQAEGQKITGFEDSHFLGLLFAGKSGTEPVLTRTRFTPGSVDSHTKRSIGSESRGLGRLSMLDRNGDERISRSEIPARAMRLKRYFDQIDENKDGFLSSEEILRIPALVDGSAASRAVVRHGQVRQAGLNRNPDITSEIQADGENITDIDSIMNGMVERYRLAGIGMVVEQNGKSLYEKSFGDFSSDTPVPIASATKWLTVATVMSAVDRGALKLDDPVSKYLPEFDGDKSKITVRQCLSATAGFSDRIPVIWNSRITLQEAVDTIAKTPLDAEPGKAFLYGGAGFQVAGMAAMIALGETDWHEIFKKTIAKPLGLKNTIYGSIAGRAQTGRVDVERKQGMNPWLGGGAISTLNDYREFLRMLANEGVYEGHRILSKSSVDEIFRIQTKGTKIIKTLHPENETPYGLGGWIESADRAGSGIIVRDMGVWGWNPWIDFGRGYFAVIGVQDDMNRLWASYQNIESIVDKVIDKSRNVSGGGANIGNSNETRTLRWQGIDRSYLIHVPAETKQPNDEMPLLIMLHAGRSNAQEWLARSHWIRESDDNGFIVAAPNAGAVSTGGSGTIALWNDGSGRNMKSDDVGFIRVMIQQISTQYHVDKRRIYLTGIGNGASMAYLAGAQLSSQIAAIAPVSGHLWDHAVKPSSPVSLISFIGTEDPINPIKPGAEREMTGQPGRVKPQVRDSILAWATALGLSRIPKVEKLPNGVTLEQYGAVGDRAEVRFYIINGMGHGWPGDDESLTFSGMTRQSIPPLDATETIWSFFSKHPKTQ